ncbi:hypothetical protein [Lyngbya confervoides]|uniref:Cell division protein FtsL n=1 Tax=Lyngbya confervoides BDU141951 TaxID=1574623 RepID=A0ABD4T120_9CYAN|nr:hypothetical protein [Lyngbya confervoides]MCM1982178.1 hypothetical protein [Lyngbya confervoides BDU141951]
MPAAVKSRRTQDERLRARSWRSQSAAAKQGQAAQFTVIESIHRPDPSWLPWVIMLRQRSTPLAIASIVGVIVLHSANVMLQQQWGKTYGQWEQAQRQQNAIAIELERQNYQLPRRYETTPENFVPQTQNNTLFLPAEPPLPPQSLPARPPSTPLDDRLPIGY